jgi:hypothetical protein
MTQNARRRLIHRAAVLPGSSSKPVTAIQITAGVRTLIARTIWVKAIELILTNFTPLFDVICLGLGIWELGVDTITA